MDQYMIAETESDSLDNYPVVWDRSQGRDSEGQSRPRADFNTATFLEYSKCFIRDKKEFSMSTSVLEGCTVLAIISRRAVYVAHYWESIAFAPDEEDLERWQTAERIFELFVEKGLRQGIGKGDKPQQHSLARNAQYIDDEYIQAYLLVPSDTWNEIPGGYPQQWAKLKNIVGDILPRLKIKDGEQNGRWHEIQYERVGTRTDLLDTHRGRCLFKFDPQHPNTERDKKVKKAMFWVEDNPVAHHSDEWD
ncbi:uncharacterized protein N0V89_000072 [Didymosphaeria variabile]|uniref:Uncharacterized protein n=1 Tax=Didymosphaeria variabile TaxID=1932322 RepID=A0A9W8XW43_9PLEO|nr:uncharacterized protein N0V89_000072 [Didymosphaeria variabile]KAJ4359517.1 hypothetical protein N0V89_000072 [Didymosphaeria variabile]